MPTPPALLTPADFKRWPHFSHAKLTCKGSGECRMWPDFLDRMERLRVAIDMPLPETSGYRSPAYNAQVSSTGLTGPHTTGRSMDIAISGAPVFALIKLAIDLGFTGIGVRQKGPHEGRIIHLDDLPDGDHPRPRVWTY